MEEQLRRDLVRYARAVHAAGWVANHDGNLSVRLGDDRYLCTPTAVSKADVTAESLIVVDGQGHYARPDVVQLRLDSSKQRPLVIEDGKDA